MCTCFRYHQYRSVSSILEKLISIAVIGQLFESGGHRYLWQALIPSPGTAILRVTVSALFRIGLPWFVINDPTKPVLTLAVVRDCFIDSLDRNVRRFLPVLMEGLPDWPWGFWFLPLTLWQAMANKGDRGIVCSHVSLAGLVAEVGGWKWPQAQCQP